MTNDQMLLNILLIAYLCLLCFDFYSTYYAVTSHVGYEKNPRMAWLISKTNLFAALAIKTIFSIALGVWLYCDTQILGLGILTVVYVWYMYGNYRVIEGK